MAFGENPRYAVPLTVCPQLTDGELNELFGASWPAHQATSFAPVLSLVPAAMAYGRRQARVPQHRRPARPAPPWPNGVEATMLANAAQILTLS